MTSDFVCPNCFEDRAIREFICDNAEVEMCDFCGAKGDEPLAASLEDVVSRILVGVSRYYSNPNNAGMSYETAEGGWQGTTYDTGDMLEGLGLDLPRDDDGGLREAIIDEIEAKTGNDLWCDADLYRLNEEDRRRLSWEKFCRLIKYERRFFFLNRHQPDDDEEIYSPSAVLHLICSCAERVCAFCPLPKGTRLFRARKQPRGESFTSALQLGPPPEDRAVQTNRMSPPGIVMTYLADDVNTALAETANKPGVYAVGEFKTQREALILDLTQLPDVPSPYEEVPDSLEYDPRDTILFLHNISRAISQPIARDDRVHVEYVPTQVVTEFIRSEAKVGGRPIDGIRYRSSRERAGTAVVLFASVKNLVLPDEDRDDHYGFYRDRWLQLVRATKRKVAKKEIEGWSQLPHSLPGHPSTAK